MNLSMNFNAIDTIFNIAPAFNTHDFVFIVGEAYGLKIDIFEKGIYCCEPKTAVFGD